MKKNARQIRNLLYRAKRSLKKELLKDDSLYDGTGETFAGIIPGRSPDSGIETEEVKVGDG